MRVRQFAFLTLCATLALALPARAQTSWGVAVNASNDLVFCDVRREKSGASTVLAGGAWGARDGLGTDAQFGRVAALAVAPDGTVVVIDSGNVRRVTPLGLVTTESVGTVTHSEAGLIGIVGLWD